MSTGIRRENIWLIGVALLSIGLLFTVGCGGEQDSIGSSMAENSDQRADTSTGGAGAPSDDDNADNAPPPEEELDFSYSQPVVSGQSLFVASENLNSVAVIDSETLDIETIPVGINPTAIGSARQSEEGSTDRVWVLNEGSSSVTVIETEGLTSTNVPVADGTNSLKVGPAGNSVITWFDSESYEDTSGKSVGDLSSVTLIKGDKTYRVAVGFNVRQVHYSNDGQRALVLTDRGVSLLDIDSISSDSRVPPVPLTGDFEADGLGDVEVKFTADGSYAITAFRSKQRVTLLDLDNESYHSVPFEAAPTDIDLISGSPPKVAVTLHGTGEFVTLEVPNGLRNAADARSVQPAVESTALASDTSSDTVVGPDGSETADHGLPDVAEPDDSPQPDVSDTADRVPLTPFNEIDGTQSVDLELRGLGSASIAGESDIAFVYTTIGDERKAILLNLESDEQRIVSLEKRVRGAIPSPDEESFVVLHRKKAGQLPEGSTPADPEYLRRSWGVSIVDIESASTRLVLTKNEPSKSAIWAPRGTDNSTRKVYFTLEPTDLAGAETAKNDVLEINLDSFRTHRYRLPSHPENIGIVRPVSKVFVSQKHAQGRMSFIDVMDGSQKTVTGYQLNAGIK